MDGHAPAVRQINGNYSAGTGSWRTMLPDHHCLGKTRPRLTPVRRRRCMGQQPVPPGVELPRRYIVPPRHRRNTDARCKSLGDDLKPLLVGPMPTPLRSRKHRDLAQRPLLFALLRALKRVVLHAPYKAAAGGWIRLTFAAGWELGDSVFQREAASWTRVFGLRGLCRRASPPIASRSLTAVSGSGFVRALQPAHVLHAVLAREGFRAGTGGRPPICRWPADA